MIDPEKYWKNYDFSQNPTNPLTNKPISNVVSICSHVAYSRVRAVLISKDSYTSTANKLQDAFESTGQISFEGESCLCLTGAEERK